MTKFSLNMFCLCLAVPAALCCFAAFAAERQPASPSTAPGKQTQACAGISGPRILAGELAATDDRFRAIPPDTEFGYTPDPGAVRWIEAPNGSAERLCVVRAAKPLGAEQLMAALELSGLGNVEARLEAWAEDPVPAGRIYMPRSGIVTPMRGTQEVLWRGSVEYEQRETGTSRSVTSRSVTSRTVTNRTVTSRSLPVWARVHLSRQQPCLRMRKLQRRGQPLTMDDVELLPCDAAAIVAEALAPADLTGDWRASVDIPSGAWLLPGHRTDAPVLKRGESATLSVRSGAVSLTLPVVAEQAGTVGQMIWVRSVADRKRFQATVTGPQQLVVDTGLRPARASGAPGESASPVTRNPSSRASTSLGNMPRTSGPPRSKIPF